MCLVHLLFQAHPDTPVLLAGNRDEFYRRPSAPPAVIARNPTVYAGRDLEAGGTWMGRNEAGLLAAITNRYGSRGAAPAEPRSRGEIVLRLLSHRDPDSAAHWAAGLALDRYRPFNVLFGNGSRFYFLSSDEGQPPRTLEPGFHALSNSTLDDRSWPKVERSHAFHEAHRRLDGEAYLDGLQRFFRDATPPDALDAADRDEEIHGALGAVLIRTEEYGTVSSSIISGGGILGDRYYFAEGDALREGKPEADLGPYRLVNFGE